MKLLTSCFCLSLRTSTKLVCKSFMVRFPFQCLVTSTKIRKGLFAFFIFTPAVFSAEQVVRKVTFIYREEGFPLGWRVYARATKGTYLCVDSKCGPAVMLADTITLCA